MRVGIALALVLVLGWLLVFWLIGSRDRADEATSWDESPSSAGDAPMGPGLKGNAPPAPAAPPPRNTYGIEVEHPNEQRKLRLQGAGGAGSVRAQTLRQMYRADVREPDLVPYLDAIIENAPEGHDREADMAHVIVMRTEGSRRHLKALALSSADRVHRSRARTEALWGWDAARVDPATGQAIVRAYQLARHGDLAKGLAEALTACGDLLVEDPVAGAKRVAEHLAAARGESRLVWLDVARLLVPIPAPYGATFASAWGAADQPTRDRLLVLLRCGLAWRETEVGTQIARVLVADTAGGWPKHASRVAEALGCLGSGAPEALAYLMRWLDDPPPYAGRVPAVKALGRIGPPAHGALERLMELGRAAGERSATEISMAVLGIGSRDALPYLADRLADGPPAERAQIAGRLAEVDGAASLTDLLVEEVRKENVQALEALVALDPTASEPSTRAAFRLAFHRHYPAKLIAKAFETTQGLTAMPDDLLELMIDGLVTSPPEARDAAVRAVGNVARLGKPARRFVDRMLALSEQLESRGPYDGQRAATWVLGELAGGDPRVRARLFELLERYAPEVLAGASQVRAKHIHMVRAALWGLGGVESPTRDQLLMVARLNTRLVRNVEGVPDGYRFMSLASRLIAKPSWQRLKQDEGIRLTQEPRPRHAVWR